jgi:hypothetical protein
MRLYINKKTGAKVFTHGEVIGEEWEESLPLLSASQSEASKTEQEAKKTAKKTRKAKGK